MKTITHAEFGELLKAQGVEREHYAFKCPICGTIQSATSLVRAGAGPDVSDDRVWKSEGFSCVGRFTGHKRVKDEAPGQGCDWTLGGFFQVHTHEVEYKGKTHPIFEPASAAEAQALREHHLNTPFPPIEKA